MHFQGARFAQAVPFHEDPEVVISGEDPVNSWDIRVLFCADGRPSVAIDEGYGQVVPGTIPNVLKMIGNVGIHERSEFESVDFLQSSEQGYWAQVLDQCERCLRPMLVWYPEVDYHADEGNERGHPCRRGPREAIHPMHNNIFSQKMPQLQLRR